MNNDFYVAHESYELLLCYIKVFLTLFFTVEKKTFKSEYNFYVVVDLFI